MARRPRAYRPGDLSAGRGGQLREHEIELLQWLRTIYGESSFPDAPWWSQLARLEARAEPALFADWELPEWIPRDGLPGGRRFLLMPDDRLVEVTHDSDGCTDSHTEPCGYGDGCWSVL